MADGTRVSFCRSLRSMLYIEKCCGSAGLQRKSGSGPSYKQASGWSKFARTKSIARSALGPSASVLATHLPIERFFSPTTGGSRIQVHGVTDAR